jgi:hypothetical protein
MLNDGRTKRSLKKMRIIQSVFLLVVTLILISNFIILRLYGDTLQSTHLFIVRGTVFYPIAWINLVCGISLGIFMLYRWLKKYLIK